MIEIQGKYEKAIIYNDNVEEEAYKQILELTNHPMSKDSNIRIMPDVHAGKGCVIGYTAKLTDKLVPNLIGVDIACGVLVAKLNKIKIDFQKLDDFIRINIPLGRNVREDISPNIEKLFNTFESFNIFSKAICELAEETNQNIAYVIQSLGTLGGGNHFIEIDIDEDDNKYLLVHTGSRNFGKCIAEYYQDIAVKNIIGMSKEIFDEKINEIRQKFSGKEIEKQINKLRNICKPKKTGLEYLERPHIDRYLDAMQVAQLYAQVNRRIIGSSISEFLGVIDPYILETVHNYIDFDDNIIRKGAIAAPEGKELIIPLNIRDGAILGKGKGNSDWNCSAPHGAGRICSRGDAKRQFNIEDYEREMKGIWSSSVNESTLDESPFAYKNSEEIINYLEPTVEVVKRLKPIYALKDDTNNRRKNEI